MALADWEGWNKWWQILEDWVVRAIQRPQDCVGSLLKASGIAKSCGATVTLYTLADGP